MQDVVIVSACRTTIEAFGETLKSLIRINRKQQFASTKS